MTSLLDLPQELWDHIFGYLLHPKEVQYTPEMGIDRQGHEHSRLYHTYGGAAHVYKFSINVFAVNRAMNKHATQYFRENATFVLVSYDTPDFTFLLHQLDVPVVTDQDRYTTTFQEKTASNPAPGRKRRLADLKLHSFAIHVQWRREPVRIPVRDISQADGDDKGPVLMLSRDLHRLYEMLRFQFTTLTSLHLYSRETMPPKMFVTASKQISLNDKRLPKIVTSLSGLEGVGFEVCLKGFGRVSKSSCIVYDLAAALILPDLWWRPQECDVLKLVLRFKNHADNLAMTGRLTAAISRYSFLHHQFYVISELVNNGSLELHKPWLVLEFDILLSLIWIAMRQGRFEELIPTTFCLVHDHLHARDWGGLHFSSELLRLKHHLEELLDTFWRRGPVFDGWAARTSYLAKTKQLKEEYPNFWTGTATIFDHQDRSTLQSRSEGRVEWGDIKQID